MIHLIRTKQNIVLVFHLSRYFFGKRINVIHANTWSIFPDNGRNLSEELHV